jgi:Acetyltransferase (GNAT) domain
MAAELAPPAGRVPAPGAGLHVERFRSPGELDRVHEAWDGFVEDRGGDIYFTVDWLQSWWTHYGGGRTFEGLLFRDGGDIVGVLPFAVERVRAAGIRVRLARLVGADSTLPVFTPAVAPGFEAPVLRTAADLLVSEHRCHAISLAPLSGESPVAAAAERVASGERFRLARSDSTGVHTVFRLPGSFDAYLAALGQTPRRDHRRSVRQLDKGFAVSYRTVSGADAVACFDRFVALHTALWRDEGKLGHFGDWPDSAAFTRELIVRMASDRRARFYEITAEDGRVLAVEQCFVLGDRCFWRLPARDPDPELRRFGLGRTSAAEMFRALIADGQTAVEAGPGHYDYKVRLNGEELPLRRVVVSGASASARVRTALLVRWADLLHLLYYRGWFLRLAPRLGRPRRPLWRAWIRSRI